MFWVVYFEHVTRVRNVRNVSNVRIVGHVLSVQESQEVLRMFAILEKKTQCKYVIHIRSVRK